MRRIVRQTHKFGSYIYATVENVSLGYASVRLHDTNTRLTNLVVMGAPVLPGDQVVVDYSAGVPPTVRQSTIYGPSKEPETLESAWRRDLPAQIPVEPIDFQMAADASFSIYTVAGQSIGIGAPVRIGFGGVTFDTANYFRPSESATRVVIPANGLYYFTGQVGVIMNVPAGAGDFIDYQRSRLANRIILTLTGSEYGVFGTHMDGPLEGEPLIPHIIEVTGFINAVVDEEVWLSVENDTSQAIITVDCDYVDHNWSNLAGFRVGGAGRGDAIVDDQLEEDQFGTGLEPDIDVDDGEGVITVIDEPESYSKAIGHMSLKSDAVATMEFKWADNTSGGSLSLVLRASNDWADWMTPTQGYEVLLESHGNVAMYRIVNGFRTLIDDIAGSPTVLTHELRFEVNGNYIRFRKWLASEAEPGTWDMEVNDTGGFTTAGGIQIGLFSFSGEHTVTVDNLLVTNP